MPEKQSHGSVSELCVGWFVGNATVMLGCRIYWGALDSIGIVQEILGYLIGTAFLFCSGIESVRHFTSDTWSRILLCTTNIRRSRVLAFGTIAGVCNTVLLGLTIGVTIYIAIKMSLPYVAAAAIAIIGIWTSASLTGRLILLLYGRSNGVSDIGHGPP